MLKEAVKEAATIEDAKLAIAAELGMAPEELEFEVLRQPQKKTLGLFGGSPARVRGFLEITPSKNAAAYLQSILDGMGVKDAAITVKDMENGCVLTLEGEDLGFIIGRRGDTLDALQYLTGLVANRVDNAYYRVTIDIGNYREKREQALVGLAKKVAGQAGRTGRRTSLEPMNPYERRIIHTAVQEMEGVISWSVGSEPNRHVVIGPSEDNAAKARTSRVEAPRGGRGSGSGPGDRGNVGGRPPREGGERPARPERPVRAPRSDGDAPPAVAPERPVRQFVPRSNPLPTADGATPPARTESEKEESATLYGRINL